MPRKGKFVTASWTKSSCKLCDFTALNKTAVRLHMKASHGIESLKLSDIDNASSVVCGVCKKSFNSLRELAQHNDKTFHKI